MDNNMKRIEGRVAVILNSRELVINIGRNRGVVPKMKFAILSETPLQVIDPESGAFLDTIDREKVRVEAVEIRDMITICKTYRVKRVSGGPLGESLAAIGADMSRALVGPREVKETLAIKDAEILPPLPEEESYVKIKDRVIQVEDE